MKQKSNIRRRPFPGILFIVGMMTAVALGQEQEATRLEDFLNRSDFRGLVKKYGDHSVQFRVKGEVQRRQEALPYTLEEGFRVQIFAGRSRREAEQVAGRARRSRLDSVYLEKDHRDGLYKVQVGDYPTRDMARIALDRWYYAGFPNGWIVETRIRVPKPKAAVSRTEGDARIFYAVQVAATGFEEKARQLSRRLEQQFAQPITVLREGPLWKVLLGRFSKREEAMRFRERLVQKGYLDAWITQILQ